jgi:hypothetical protein
MAVREPAPSLPGQAGSPGGAGRTRSAPLVIDLRDPDAALVPDEAVTMPLMAVATPAEVGEADPAQPANGAERDEVEEPVAMADEQAADAVQDDEAVTDEAVTDEAVTDEAPAAEQSAEAEPEAEAEAAGEPVAEATAEPAVAERAATEEFQVASEFSWSSLEFTPLVWRYDAEPEAATIDLREPAAVDLREDAGHKAPRRKRARR